MDFIYVYFIAWVAFVACAHIVVFLKYYHVELLAKLYEEQLRKIILVQACIRRWLARVHFKRARFTMTQSAMTVQRYVRGWLTRKRLLQMRNERKQRQKEEQQLREQRKQSIKERECKCFFYSFQWSAHTHTHTYNMCVLFCVFLCFTHYKLGNILLSFRYVSFRFRFRFCFFSHSQLTAIQQQQVQKAMAKKKQQQQQQHLISDSTPENNENRKLNCSHICWTDTFSSHNFIVHVIDYRSHTIRMKRWLPEIEQQIFYAFNVAKTENEAVQFLLNLGLTSHEIDLILQNFLTNTELNIRKREQYKKLDNYRERTPLTVQEQQLELIGFSQGVSQRLSSSFTSTSIVFFFLNFFSIFSTMNRCIYWIKRCIRICDAIKLAFMLIALMGYHRTTSDQLALHYFQHY